MDPLLALIADSAASVSTGLGVIGTDKSRDARPAQPAWLTRDEMESTGIVDGIIRRMIYAVPEDTLDGGWRTDEGDARDVTADLDAELALETNVVLLDQMARCYGASLMLLVCKGVQDLAEPLPPGPHEVLAVQVFTGREFFALAPFTSDLRSQNWGRPEWWSIAPIRPGLPGYAAQLTRVHHSHVVYMPGLPLPPSQTVPGMLGFHLSVPQAYWERARDLGLAMRSAALAAMEQSMLVLNLKGGRAAVGGDARTSVMERLALWDQGRSTRRASVVMGDDQAYRLEAPLTGFDAIVSAQEKGLACLEGFPLTYMIGVTPGGMSTDDESGRRTLEKLFTRRRRNRIVPVLNRVYEIAFGPGTREYVFPPVFPMTPKERADLSTALATRGATWIANGVITPDEERGRINAQDGDDEAMLPVLAEADE